MDQQRVTIATGPWAMRLVLLVVGVGALLGGVGYGLRTPEGLVGAGLMPAIAGGVMIAASLWESARAIREDRARVAAGPDPDAEAEEEPELDVMGRTTAQRNRAVVLIFGIILLTIVLAYVIGLLLALSLMVIVLLGVVEKSAWWVALIGGVAAFAFGYLVFGVALQVALPTGMLGLV